MISDSSERELVRATQTECDLSVVIPVFNEAEKLESNLGVIVEVLETLGLRFELVVVDDGSRDATWDRLTTLAKKPGSLIAGIRLSRNFGKEAALCAGLEVARGQACIVMDVDLQHPPSLIPEMVRLWRVEQFPIVEAVKKRRGREGILNRVGARIFYSAMHRLAGMNLDRASDFKLLDARIVAAWRLMKERQPFFRGMTAWLGFPRAFVYFEVPERNSGVSRWSHFSLARLAVSAITSFSYLPMQVVTTLGVLFLAAAFPLGLQTLYNKFSGAAVSGFTTVIILLLIVGSVLMISMGVIGTYIARVLDEVKGRPRYIVADKAGAQRSRES